MTICRDKSDQVFVMDKPCTEEEFVKKYNETICTGANGVLKEDEHCYRLDDIIRDHNTSAYWNPHHCTNSCKYPGYGCLACSNPEYFRCTKNHQSVCIHPDLHCNHHPDCDDAEDEKYEDCKDEYMLKSLL